MAHQKCINESWGGRVLIDADSDEKQGIYFAWPKEMCFPCGHGYISLLESLIVNHT